MTCRNSMKWIGLCVIVFDVIFTWFVHIAEAGNPTGTPDDDQWIKWWNWSGGEWTTIVSAGHVEPSQGLYTCKGGPLWLTVTLRDRDAWNNYGEHYHADGILKEIKLTDAASVDPEPFEWGASSTLIAEPDNGTVKTNRTYRAAAIECTAPNTTGPIAVYFRGIDITESEDEHGIHNDPNEFGDDPPIGQAPDPQTLHETGSEFCEPVGAIQVFDVDITVVNKIASLGSNLCSDSLCDNGDEAYVSIAINPSFWSCEQIPIRLKLTDTSVAHFGTGVAYCDLTQGGLPTTLYANDSDGTGTFTIKAYYVIDGVEYQCTRTEGTGKVFTLEAKLRDFNSALNVQPRSEPTSVVQHLPVPTPRVATNYYQWIDVSTCKGGGENCSIEFNGEVEDNEAKPIVFGHTLPRGTNSGSESKGTEWGGRMHSYGKVHVVSDPVNVGTFQVELGGTISIASVNLHARTDTTHSTQGFSPSINLGDWFSFDISVGAVSGGSVAGAFVRIEAEAEPSVLENQMDRHASSDYTQDPIGQHAPADYNGSFELSLGGSYDVGEVNGQGAAISVQLGASAARNAFTFDGHAEASCGSISVVPASYHIVDEQ